MAKVKPAPDWPADETEGQGRPVAVDIKVSEPPPAPASTQGDSFPSDLNKALELFRSLSRFNRLGGRPTPEQLAGHAQLQRLRPHIKRLQQGNPVVETTALTPGAFIGLQVSARTKLEYQARINPDVKNILAAHDALAKENAELKELLQAAK